MRGDAIKLAQLSGQIQTVDAAIKVLGVARDQLEIADQAVAILPSTYAQKDMLGALGAFLTGQTSDLQSQLRDEIAQARADVERYAAFYVGYTGDDLTQEISTGHSMGIAATVQYVNKVLNDCIDDISDNPQVTGIDFVNGVEQVLQTVVTAAGQAAQSVAQAAANTTAGLLSAFWVPLVVVGGGVALVVLWQKGLLKASA